MAHYLNKKGNEMGRLNPTNKTEIRYIIVDDYEDIEANHLDIIFGIEEEGYYMLDEETGAWINIDDTIAKLKEIKNFMMMA